MSNSTRNSNERCNAQRTQLWQSALLTIPYGTRHAADSDLHLFDRQRWIALENRDGSYTWIDQALNTTKRIDGETLVQMISAIEMGGPYGNIH